MGTAVGDGKADFFSCFILDSEDVFRRSPRTGDIAPFPVFLEPGHDEPGVGFQDGKGFFQECLVPREAVAVHQVGAGPRPIHQAGRVFGYAPDVVGFLPAVHVVAKTKAVKFQEAGEFFTAGLKADHEFKEGTVVFPQSGHVGRPLVHLAVDVQEKAPLPGGVEIRVPQPLQAAGQRAGRVLAMMQ